MDRITTVGVSLTVKPTLYALLAKRARINIANGDSINELRTLSTLSHHFDVFYNNEAFGKDKPEIGDFEIGPTREYDFYYIRNNSDIFRSIEGRKLSFAYPYDEVVFRDSFGFLVLTENWKAHLRRENRDSDAKVRGIYDGVSPIVDQPILNVGQVYDPSLAEGKIVPATQFEMRCMTTGSVIFGYYGNLNKDLYPYKAFAALERLYDERGNISPMIALAGDFRQGSHIKYRNSIHVGSVPYQKMAALHANTLANLTNESPLNHCLGNQKVIDSLSRGVPVMCQRLDTFVYQLGDDYPCFYETEDQAYAIARQLVVDSAYLDHARRASRARAEFFSPENVRQRFLSQPDLNFFS